MLHFAIRSSLRQAYPDGFNVLAVGFASFVMNLVGVSHAGVAMTPVFTYARHSPELATLAQLLRNDARFQQVHQHVGTVIHSSYANTQLTQYYQDGTHPSQNIIWQTVASFLLAKWTDCAHAPISTSEASWTGLLNVKTATWDETIAEACKIPFHHLPALTDVTECLSSKLTAEYSSRWPELSTARLHYGLGDGAAANIGSQCDQPGRIAVTIGTSAAARVILPAACAASLSIPAGLWCYRVDATRLLLGGALTDGGSAVAWFRDTYRVSDAEFSSLEQEIDQQMRACQHPEVFALTLFGGERSPGWIDHATASFHGITRSTSRASLLRAIMEGVCFRIKEILLRIEIGLQQAAEVESDSGEVENIRLIVSGGALEQSKLWRCMLCQIAGKSVYTVRAATELTSLGVGTLLLSAIAPVERSEKVDDADLLLDSEPQADIVQMYCSAFEQHRNLYRQSWELST